MTLMTLWNFSREHPGWFQHLRKVTAIHENSDLLSRTGKAEVAIAREVAMDDRRAKQTESKSLADVKQPKYLTANPRNLIGWFDPASTAHEGSRAIWPWCLSGLLHLISSLKQNISSTDLDSAAQKSV